MQRLTQLTNVVFEDGVTYEGARPNCIQYLLLIDELSGVRKQQFQNRESLWAQRNRAGALPQTLVCEIKPKFPESDLFRSLDCAPPLQQ
jgi:hypothetical protein